MSRSQTEPAIGGPPLQSTPAPRWATLVATFFGIGRLRPAPGTWGSLATVLLWWLIAPHLAPPFRLVAILLLIVLAVAIGIPAATLEARGCGKKDPSHVVIDEVAGQLLTLVACPIVWRALLAGFILFRVFDILKPPPIRSLEKLPEGTGIVVDDLGAGVYGLIVLQLLLHFGVIRWS
jgi:phosphatidylglycerophosphatase A